MEKKPTNNDAPRCSKIVMDKMDKSMNLSYLTIIIIAIGIIAYLLFIFFEYFGFPLWLNILVIVFLLIPMSIILIGVIYKRQCKNDTSSVINV